MFIISQLWTWKVWAWFLCPQTWNQRVNWLGLTLEALRENPLPDLHCWQSSVSCIYRTESPFPCWLSPASRTASSATCNSFHLILFIFNQPQSTESVPHFEYFFLLPLSHVFFLQLKEILGFKDTCDLIELTRVIQGTIPVWSL